jgi:hypothetical protein
MKVKLTFEVILPDTEEKDGQIFINSEEDIIDMVADLYFSFDLSGKKLKAKLIEVMCEDTLYWTGE